MNQIKRTNSVAVHVRRGDYLNKNNKKVYGGICTIVYYEKAIQKILDLIDSPTFFIFSNEIEWVEKKICIYLMLFMFVVTIKAILGRICF